MRYITSFLLIFFFTVVKSFSQLEQPIRVEIEVESEKEDNAVIPVGADGLIMYNLSDEKVKEHNKSKWYFTGYNSDFKEIWRSAYIINGAYKVRNHYYAEGVLYLLYGRYNREDVSIAAVDVKSGKIRTLPGKLPRKFLVQSISMHHGESYIRGVIGKKAALVHVDLEKGIFSSLTLKFEGQANFESIEYDTLAYKANLVYTVGNKALKYIQIKSFRGVDQVGDLAIKPEGDDNLLSGKITSINGNEKIIIGTYAVRGNSGSSGLYFARLFNESQFVISYYNFTDFQHFFDFLSNRDKDKIQRKKEKKEAKGKELNLEYQLLVHDLILKNGEYVMVAEAYHPTYRTEPYTYTTIINGVPIMQTRYVTVFDGWQYTHAVVAGFDNQGLLLWDNSIEMGDFKSFDLEPRVSVNSKGDDVVLTYGTYEEIKTKVIRGQEVVDAKQDQQIKTGNNDDVVKRAVLSNVNYWYDNYFIVWGYQRIRNDGQTTLRGKRTVFYFNKIAFK